jgi:hypothetical protein
MIRGLKILTGVALAVAAFGAISASGAQAAKFHCSVSPCRLTLRPDGTGTTAHHVLIIKKGPFSASFTCKKLEGEAVLEVKEATSAKFNNIAYKECSVAGSASTIDTAGCGYKIFSESEQVNLECESGKDIQITVGPCTITIQGQILTGVRSHNIGKESETTTEITTEVLLKGISGSVGASCKGVLGFENEAFTEGEYTTGNTIVTGETSPGGVMANTWWA